MSRLEAEDNFPVETGSRTINFFQKLILICVKILALFMTIVIICSVVDVGITLYKSAVRATQWQFSFDEILSVLGGFLVVLIAIEIFINIILYLRQDMSHLKLVLATALMAVARKVIILDYDHVKTYHLFGISGIILALGVAYWLIKHPKRNSNFHQEKIDS